MSLQDLFGSDFSNGLEIITEYFSNIISGWEKSFNSIFSGGNYEDSYSYIINGAKGIPFAIPEQIFVAIDTLTRVVGYVMPLRLYMPIIILILSYWLVMILFSVLKATFNIFNGVFFSTKK